MPRRADLQVWAIRLDLEPAVLERFARLLSPDETARAERLRRPADRGRFIAGRAQLRALLGRVLDADPAAIRFARGPAGKPVLDGSGRPSNLHFNASGSAALGLVVLREGAEVGVDVEALRPMPNVASLAERLLSTRERPEFEDVPPAGRERRFFEYWVRKEAVAKSLGAGLGEGLNRMSLYPWAEAGVFRLDVPRDGAAVAQWVAPLSLPQAGYVGAVASWQPFESRVDVRAWTASPDG